MNSQSEHIASFDSTHIPYAGYQPGTKNDEIHTDLGKQHMFAPDVVDKEDPTYPDYTNESADLSRASHAALRSYAVGHHLFYILIHDIPKLYDDFMFSEIVLLFALGVSPATGNLPFTVPSVGFRQHSGCGEKTKAWHRKKQIQLA